MPKLGKDLSIWNLYINKVDKLEYMKTLVSQGHLNAQSAAIRAFMIRYSIDDNLRKLMDPYIEDQKVNKLDGTESRL